MTAYDLSAPIAAEPLAMVQWSQMTLLGNNLDFWVYGPDADPQPVPLGTIYENMKDLDMNFNVPPEFTKKGGISVDEALSLAYNGGYVSPSSLLYPENMYNAFYDYATTGVFTGQDEEVTNYVVDWFTEQLTYNGEQAQGTFMAKTVESGHAFLLENFGNEAAARNLAYQINVE